MIWTNNHTEDSQKNRNTRLLLEFRRRKRRKERDGGKTGKTGSGGGGEKSPSESADSLSGGKEVLKVLTSDVRISLR